MIAGDGTPQGFHAHEDNVAVCCKPGRPNRGVGRGETRTTRDMLACHQRDVQR
jgi:hypothetical protein